MMFYGELEEFLGQYKFPFSPLGINILYYVGMFKFKSILFLQFFCDLSHQVLLRKSCDLESAGGKLALDPKRAGQWVGCSAGLGRKRFKEFWRICVFFGPSVFHIINHFCLTPILLGRRSCKTSSETIESSRKTWEAHCRTSLCVVGAWLGEGRVRA